MNKNAAGLLAGVAAAGLGVGGFCGYLLAVHRLQGRFDRDLEELQAYYSSRNGHVQRATAVTSIEQRPSMGHGRERIHGSDGRTGESGGVVEDRNTPEDHLPDTFRDDEGIDPYMGLEDDDYEESAARSFGTNGLGDEEEYALDSEAYGTVDDEDDNSGSGSRSSGPYIISEEQFSEEQLDFQKLSVTYYRGDNILCDDQDSPIRDVEGTIGHNVEQMFSGGEAVAFVRNNWLEVDFEVKLNLGAWTEVVLKYGSPSPKPRHILPGEGL